MTYIHKTTTETDEWKEFNIFSIKEGKKINILEFDELPKLTDLVAFRFINRVTGGYDNWERMINMGLGTIRRQLSVRELNEIDCYDLDNKTIAVVD